MRAFHCLCSMVGFSGNISCIQTCLSNNIRNSKASTGFVVSRMSMSILTCKDPQIFPKNIMSYESYASRWVARPSVKGQCFSRPRRTSSLGVLPADYNFFVDFKCLGGWNFGQIQQMALVPFVPAICVHSSTGMCSHINRSVTREWSIVTQFYQCGLHMI